MMMDSKRQNKIYISLSEKDGEPMAPLQRMLRWPLRPTGRAEPRGHQGRGVATEDVTDDSANPCRIVMP